MRSAGRRLSACAWLNAAMSPDAQGCETRPSCARRLALDPGQLFRLRRSGAVLGAAGHVAEKALADLGVQLLLQVEVNLVGRDVAVVVEGEVLGEHLVLHRVKLAVDVGVGREVAPCRWSGRAAPRSGDASVPADRSYAPRGRRRRRCAAEYPSAPSGRRPFPARAGRAGFRAARYRCGRRRSGARCSDQRPAIGPR